MSLPTDTRGAAAGSSYTKFEQGATELLILGDAVPGYQYWTEDGVKRSREVFAETPGIRQKKVKDKKTGVETLENEKQQYFWALPVYNFKTANVEMWQITQKGLRDKLAALQANDNWGDPTGKYTITVTKSGEGFETKYEVTPNPNQTEKAKASIAHAIEAYKENELDVESDLFKN